MECCQILSTERFIYTCIPAPKPCASALHPEMLEGMHRGGRAALGSGQNLQEHSGCSQLSGCCLPPLKQLVFIRRDGNLMNAPSPVETIMLGLREQ